MLGWDVKYDLSLSLDRAYIISSKVDGYILEWRGWRSQLNTNLRAENRPKSLTNLETTRSLNTTITSPPFQPQCLSLVEICICRKMIPERNTFNDWKAQKCPKYPTTFSFLLLLLPRFLFSLADSAFQSLISGDQRRWKVFTRELVELRRV